MQVINYVVLLHVGHVLHIDKHWIRILTGMGTLRRQGDTIEIWANRYMYQETCMKALLDTARQFQMAHCDEQLLLQLPGASEFLPCPYKSQQILKSFRKDLSVWLDSREEALQLTCLGQPMLDDDAPMWFFQGMCAGALIRVHLTTYHTCV